MLVVPGAPGALVVLGSAFVSVVPGAPGALGSVFVLVTPGSLFVSVVLDVLDVLVTSRNDCICPALLTFRDIK